MHKIKVNIKKSYLSEAENILFETVPNNWMLSLNRKTKQLFLEGIFENKEEANDALLDFQKRFSQKIDDFVVTEIDDDWKESYKYHFTKWNYKGYSFVPEWDRNSLDSNPKNNKIYIDPGMAFGTGTHETTRLCIEILIDIYTETSDTKNSFLDVGCGSGILSILAYFLGFKKIQGIDNDDDAIKSSKDNSALNFHESIITFTNRNISTFYGDYFDCVVANIQSDILINNAHNLIRLLNRKGNLVLSGILNYEVEDVAKVFDKLFATKNLINNKVITAKGDWCSIKYQML